MNPFDPGRRMSQWRDDLRDPSATAKQVGIMMVAETMQRFEDQAYGGDAWKPRGVPNVYGIIADFAAGKSSPPGRRFDATPALRDTGALSSRIDFRLLGSDAVEVGSNLPYAAVHNVGGTIESEKITDRVLSLLSMWLDGAGAKWRKNLGFLFSKKLRDKRLTTTVEARRFVGVTDETIEAVRVAIGVSIFQVH